MNSEDGFLHRYDFEIKNGSAAKGILKIEMSKLTLSNSISSGNRKETIRFKTGSVNTSALIVIGKSSNGKWSVHADDFGVVEVNGSMR